MSEDLKYVIKMVNLIATSFIALVLSILGVIASAIYGDYIFSDVFLVVGVGLFVCVVCGTAFILSGVDLKRGDFNE